MKFFMHRKSRAGPNSGMSAQFLLTGDTTNFLTGQNADNAKGTHHVTMMRTVIQRR